MKDSHLQDSCSPTPGAAERMTEAVPRLHLHTQWRSAQTVWQRFSGDLLDVGRSVAGMLSRPPKGRDWIIMPFYHWVLDDQRDAFRRQLKFLRRYGDFISLDDAVKAMGSPAGLRGRHFCITFDDGYKNFYTNAAPVLSELNVPAAIFLSTRFIGLSLEEDWEQIAPFYRQSWRAHKRFFEFLDWDECRELVAAGFTLGSHTHSHARMTDLPPAEAEEELTLSKQIIEKQVRTVCRHFCCPWGRAGRDFDPIVHPAMARSLGYDSFLTTDYGIITQADSPLAIRRIGSIPSQRLLVLRYCLFSVWLHSLRGRVNRAMSRARQ